MLNANLRYRRTPDFDAWLKDNGPFDVSAYANELEQAASQGLTERVIDEYDAETERGIWHEYKGLARQGRWWPWKNNTSLVFYLQRRLVARVLRADHNCSTIVNFGAFYAEPDVMLARKFPNRRFFGVDRHEQVKALNEAEFGVLPNLTFVASDILTFLRGTALSGGLLVHNRTALVMYPRMMEELYDTCRTVGIKHIVAIELAGYSHQLRKFYQFGDTPSPSAVLRPGNLVHDYPNMLRAAGYEIVSAWMQPSPMRKPRQRDSHLICIHAARN